VQVDPLKPKLKPPGAKRLKLKCDILLTTCASRFNLRRCNVVLRFISNHGGFGGGGSGFMPGYHAVAVEPAGAAPLCYGQGLTLVHMFAQPQPFLSLKPAKHPTTWDRKCSR
jgi:hypothetical protein